ncbi:hypothetical protein R5W23_002425 [Gemmata sp. JC673]|uniref:Uncharacterized protein n=1 Tax=Gemmata algarum TaxID=2975278 RepID=A0ABU5F5M1_9BACT|nr:hypothetical protein [Gemmata algarum]MDY3561164.1 hypothetical protein [Gemmata algarum]
MFYNEPWFWAPVFGLFGALSGPAIKQLLDLRHQMKVERLKIHEPQILEAYKVLYGWLASAGNTLFDPGEPRREFMDLMKSYFKTIKPIFLLYPPEIRDKLMKFEQQYHAATNSDFIVDIPLDTFIGLPGLKVVNELHEAVEKRTDAIYHR